ncbi:unnamed protein product [Parascedosporium putredinis]|uniref:Phospholipid/glycerol acyltransferase domain-containing protein n=1 Tax=Parascedosporium putredinis TaxID=1442378 RepID=A0A9P1H4W8_9PEZI|nr:unnamed protein product [Parascedosporium putredinis]CAI7998659.1 unnamed protein product [Parascedosporium putredinis]
MVGHILTHIFVPDLVYEASSVIAWTIWRWIQVIFEVFNGAEIVISGDPLPYGESAVVVSNHVAWCDFFTIQALAVRSGMLSRCRYFAKIQLRLVPFLGWGLWAMGMPLVTRNWLKDKRELDRVFAGIVKRRWPTCNFSEATRFTEEKYEQSKLWCKENDKPQPKHALYPRTKGFITTVQHLRQAPQIKAVYDVTIAYAHNGQFLQAPTMWDTIRLPELTRTYGHKFHIHARRFLIEDLPETDDELAKWLENIWVEKGEWLEKKKEEWESSSPKKHA